MDAVNVSPVAPANRWREGALDPAARLAYSIPREMRPVRLVAQDTRLSRGQQGFESPTGRQHFTGNVILGNSPAARAAV